MVHNKGGKEEEEEEMDLAQKYTSHVR